MVNSIIQYAMESYEKFPTLAEFHWGGAHRVSVIGAIAASTAGVLHPGSVRLLGHDRQGERLVPEPGEGGLRRSPPGLRLKHPRLCIAKAGIRQFMLAGERDPVLPPHQVGGWASFLP